MACDRGEPKARLLSGVRLPCCGGSFRCCASASLTHAADRYAVVITGASGGSAYAEKYNSWRTALVTLLKQKLKYPDDRLFVLAESEGQNVARATRENVRRLFDTLRSRLAAEDTLFVFLIGHGTAADNDDAKFNLVGPDLTSAEWSQLLKPVPGRLVFIDTTAASYPFMHRLAAPGRVVVTATDTRRPAVRDDLPRVRGPGVRRSGCRRRQERPRVDLGGVQLRQRGGASSGSSATASWPPNVRCSTTTATVPAARPQSPGPDGALARCDLPGAEPPDSARNDLLKRRAELERQLDDLRVRKASSPDPALYDAEIEKVLVEIARLSRESKRSKEVRK